MKTRDWAASYVRHFGHGQWESGLYYVVLGNVRGRVRILRLELSYLPSDQLRITAKLVWFRAERSAVFSPWDDLDRFILEAKYQFD